MKWNVTVFLKVQKTFRDLEAETPSQAVAQARQCLPVAGLLEEVELEERDPIDGFFVGSSDEEDSGQFLRSDGLTPGESPVVLLRMTKDGDLQGVAETSVQVFLLRETETQNQVAMLELPLQGSLGALKMLASMETAPVVREGWEK